MNANFMKNFMDIDEFLAIKDLCTGLSRTESDYSEDEIDHDLLNLIDDEYVSLENSLSQFDSSSTPTSLTTPGIRRVSCSDTDEGLGESICSADKHTSLSSSESLTSVNSNENGKPAKKKRKIKHTNHTKKAAPRKRRSKTSDGANTCPKPGGVVQPRNIQQSVDESAKDDKYWERRRKNNQAAKRSRDLKRQKEMSVKERAACLEEENRQLRQEVQKLKEYVKTLDDKTGIKTDQNILR